MPVFGIADEEFATLPESVQTALKTQEAEQVANKATVTNLTDRLKALETKVEPPVVATPVVIQKTREDVAYETAYEAKSEVLKSKLRSRYPDWPLFEAEIEELIKAQNSPEAAANEAFVTNCYHVVKGRHADEIANDRAKGEGKYFMEPANKSTNMPTPVKEGADALTPEQKAYAAKVGIPLDKYAASVKAVL
jgi:hypothetical protein